MSDDTATVLAEVLAAINTYDPLMFTDQHRALFERAAAQPPPSVPAGAEVAEVLAGLVEEMREIAAEQHRRGTPDYAAGLEFAAIMVQAAQHQATSGARPAGATPSALPVAPSLAATDELIERCALAAAEAAFTASGVDNPLDHDWWREYAGPTWRDVARAVLAAAPPTPSTPGVAELLAECARRMDVASGIGTPFTPSQIVRYLAPGGAGEGT